MSKVYEVDPDADALIILSGEQSGLANGDAHPGSLFQVVNGTSSDTQEELRIKVSSKHLSLASKPFRKRLAQTSGHSPTTQFDSRIHVRVEGFDPTAVKIVLNILHGKASRVPKALDLETLAKVAAFVDVLKCNEAVEVHAERWIVRLAHTSPSRLDSGLGCWIFISYVFRHSDIFATTTRQAILQSPGMVSIPGVRLPDSVTSKRLHFGDLIPLLTLDLGTIESRRQALVGKALSVVQALVTDLEDDGASCVMGCDLLLLGSLVKALHQWKLDKPYTGVSFEAVADSLRGLQNQVWHVGANPSKNLNPARNTLLPRAAVGQESLAERFPAHYCGIRSLLNPKFHSLEISVSGLDLDKSLGS